MACCRALSRLTIFASLIAPLSLALSGQPHEGASALWDAQEIGVELAPTDSLGRALELAVFGRFAPGMTIEDATARFGEPLQTLGDAHYSDWRYARYKTAVSYVDVAYEPGHSSCGTYERRSLYASPLDSPWPLRSILSSAVLARLVLPPGTLRLRVSGHGERAWLLVHDGSVRIINWHRDPPYEAE